MTPSIAQIQAVACQQFGVTMLDMLSDRRGKTCTRARHVAMWLARHTTFCSFPEIGRAFRRDHTTVMVACRAIDELREHDWRVAQLTAELREQLSTQYTQSPKLRVVA